VLLANSNAGGHDVTTQSTLNQPDELPVPEHMQPTPTVLDMMPGPQPWNSGITPQRYLDAFQNGRPVGVPQVTRDEVEALRSEIVEVADAVAELEASQAGRRP
jgi:hypothetical protein